MAPNIGRTAGTHGGFGISRENPTGILSETIGQLSDEEARQTVAANDVLCLNERDHIYGSSWKKRGGVGAFMMLARKWDRLENILSKNVHTPGFGTANKYDIFEFLELNPGNVLDDVRDLRRYLLLVESELLRRGKVCLDSPKGP
jgi:hypothetical protein